MSQPFQFRIFDTTQFWDNELKLELQARNTDIDNVEVALSIVSGFVSLAWDRHFRYLGLFNSVGGKGWLELANSELKLIDYLYSLSVSISRI